MVFHEIIPRVSRFSSPGQELRTVSLELLQYCYPGSPPVSFGAPPFFCMFFLMSDFTMDSKGFISSSKMEAPPFFWMVVEFHGNGICMYTYMCVCVLQSYNRVIACIILESI